MIRINDLDFRYRDEFHLAVGEVSIGAGEAVALVGPSGTGKTTLLHLIAGIRTPRRGTVTVAGTEVSSLGDAPRREFRIRNIGLVFQEFELLGYLDVMDNVLLPYRISALPLDDRVRNRAAALLTSVGLGGRTRRLARRLSHGEKQRVALCRAMLGDPELLLADEPTGNLDADNRDRVLDILFEHTKQRGATLVTVTHDHEVFDRFDRVIDVRELTGSGGSGS